MNEQRKATRKKNVIEKLYSVEENLEKRLVGVRVYVYGFSCFVHIEDEFRLFSFLRKILLIFWNIKIIYM